ncbi:MAG TPA: hypothetical protein VJ436_11295 [Anaerolineales bacterium]|nr:hypothetical protein [Anaerolineales bacterium]
MDNKRSIKTVNPVRFGGLWLLLCVLLAACSLLKVDNIEEPDLVGVWKEDSESCENGLPDCAWFEFKDGGHFEAKNIPGKYFGFFLAPPHPYFDASGGWEIELSADPLGKHKILLRFDQVSVRDYPVYNDVLYVSGKKGRFNLFAWHGDTSNRVTYLKVSTEDED